MIRIFGSGADGHIRLPVCMKAFTAQAQRRNYQGRALPTELMARHAGLPDPIGEAATTGAGEPTPLFIPRDRIRLSACSDLRK
jgi:hypothetical protein